MTDNRTTELLPCPFCGGEAEMLTAESMNGDYLFGIMCNDCRSRGDVYDTEAEAIAAWNTRTHGTLTADQVERAIRDCSTYASYDGCTYYASGIRLQAIADELNAERHVETCENMREKFGYKRLFVCSECGVTFDPDCEINYCPWCGREVVG